MLGIRSLGGMEAAWSMDSLGNLPTILEGLTKVSVLDPLPELRGAQFSSVVQSCPTLCDPMDCSTLGFPVHHQFLELYTNSCLLSRWCHSTISSSVVPFSSHL